MTGGHLQGDAIRIAAVRQVATLMAAAAITAPKSGGQLFLAGKPSFLETVIVEDSTTRRELADWLRARDKERREAIRSATPRSPRPSVPRQADGRFWGSGKLGIAGSGAAGGEAGPGRP